MNVYCNGVYPRIGPHKKKREMNGISLPEKCKFASALLRKISRYTALENNTRSGVVVSIRR